MTVVGGVGCVRGSRTRFSTPVVVSDCTPASSASPLPSEPLRRTYNAHTVYTRTLCSLVALPPPPQTSVTTGCLARRHYLYKI